MIRIIHLDMFNLDVAVFRSEKARHKELTRQGCTDLNEHIGAALSSAHRDYSADGTVRLSLVIKKAATKATWAHECCHMADFIATYTGIPISEEATEFRAYLVGYLFARLEELL